MSPCELWLEALIDHVDGAAVSPEALVHFRSCPACARELSLQRRAAEALAASSESFRLSPFLPPVMPRRRDRLVLGAAGIGVLGVFLALHGLVNPDPWTALIASFGVLTPFSRAVFHQAGWASVLALSMGLAAAGWGLKRLLR